MARAIKRTIGLRKQTLLELEKSDMEEFYVKRINEQTPYQLKSDQAEIPKSHLEG